MERCEECSDEAGYICICLENHLCSSCIVDHIQHDKTLDHRTVSLSHPLLSLLLESEEIEDEDQFNINEQIKALEDFRDKCIELIDSKIHDLQEQECLEVPLISSNHPNNYSNQSTFRSKSNLLVKSIRYPKPLEESYYNPGSIFRSSLNKFKNTEQYCYRVLVCGSEKVGKSCIISSFKHIHEGVAESSNLVCRSISIENLKVSLEITEARNGDHTDNALGALVVFDLTNFESFTEAEQIINNIEKSNPVLGVIILVGTRLDLVVSNPRQRISSFIGIQNFAINRGVLYDEISAVNYNHVEELFMRLIRELYKKSNSIN